VLCVGAYALGALSFPILDDDTATPVVQIEPNQTEVALQASAAQQTQEAAQPIRPPIHLMHKRLNSQAQHRLRVYRPDAHHSATPTPSPLPGAEETVSAAPTSGETVNPAASGMKPRCRSFPRKARPYSVRRPVEQATQAIGLPSGPEIPPTLDAIKTEMVTVPGART